MLYDLQKCLYFNEIFKKKQNQKQKEQMNAIYVLMYMNNLNFR